MNPDELWAEITRRIARAQQRGDTVTPGHIDQAVSQLSGGKFVSRDALKAALSQQELRQPGVAEGLARSVAQGGTLGFSDELAGAVSAVPALLGGRDVGAAYRGARDEQRGLQSSFHQAHGGLDFLGQTLGGLAIPVGLGGAAAKAGLQSATPLLTMLKLAGRGAAAGGVVGATAGAGYSEASTAGGVAKDAARGGLLGGGAGLALGGLLLPTTGAAGAIGTGVRTIRNPRAVAQEMATRDVTASLPENAWSRMTALEARRPGEGLVVDLGAGPARGLRAQVNQSPAAEEMAAGVLDARNKWAGTRLATTLDEVSGLGIKAPVAAQGAAKAALRPLAKSLYDPLAETYPMVDHPAVLRMLGAASEADLPPRKILNAVREAYASHRSPTGGLPGFLELQATQERLNELATAAFKRPSGGTQGRVYADAAKELSLAMEEAMPGYRAAQAGYATTKAGIRAYDLGFRAVSRAGNILMDAETLTKTLADLQASGGQEAVENFRRAALGNLAKALRNKASGANAAKVLADLGPEGEARLNLLLPEGVDFANLLADARMEKAFARSRAATQGNSTTAKQSADMTKSGNAPLSRYGAWARGWNWLVKQATGEDYLTEHAKAATAQYLSPDMERAIAERARRAMLLDRHHGLLGGWATGTGAAAGGLLGRMGAQ